MEQTDPPAKVASTEGLGVISELRAMLAKRERSEFERWAIDSGRAYRDSNGFWFNPSESEALWYGWSARASLSAKCRGVRHAGCEYLAPCSGICDKCGRAT